MGRERELFGAKFFPAIKHLGWLKQGRPVTVHIALLPGLTIFGWVRSFPRLRLGP